MLDNAAMDIVEVIEVTKNVVLIIKEWEHQTLGQCLEISQYFKGEKEVIAGGSIMLPLSVAGEAVVKKIEAIMMSYGKNSSPYKRLKKWLENNQHEGKESLPFMRKQEAPAIVQPLTNKTVKAAHRGKVSKERLQEPISGMKYCVQDIVYFIKNNQAFDYQLTIPESQLKVVIYYAFGGGRNLITGDVSRYLAALNITNTPKKIYGLLKELAEDGMLQYEERVSKKMKRNYTVWKFKEVEIEEEKKSYNYPEPQLKEVILTDEEIEKILAEKKPKKNYFREFMEEEA